MRIRPRNLAPILLLLLVGTGVYLNSLDNGFVYDDLVTVEENFFIRDWSNLGKFFSRDYYARSEEYSFRPLVTLTYFSDWALFREDPRGYHLTNLLLHLLAGLAVYALARKICSAPGLGFLTALIFLVHPAQTEAVNGISFREDLLCAIFCFLSLLSFVKTGWKGKMDTKSYALSLLFFILALLAKEMAVALPVVIAAYLRIIQRRRWTELLRPSILVFFLIAALYGAARLLFLFQAGTLPAAPEFGDPFARLVLALKSLGLYGRLAFLPVRLTVEYPDPFSPVIWSSYLVLPALLTAAFLLAAGIRGKNPIGKFGLAFFFLALLPVLNLVPTARLGAERFIYLPLMGFAVWAAETLGQLSVGRRKVVIPAALVFLIALGAGTVSRNRDWADNYTLFKRAVEVSPGSSKARHGLGNEYFRLGRTAAAIEEFQRAIAIFPREPLYYNSLGVAYGEEGRFEESLLQFQRSAALNPGDPLVRLNLSTLFLRTGDIGRALEEIDGFIAARPFEPDGYLNRGEILLAQSDFSAAADSFRQALALHPRSFSALSGLGYCHYRLGEWDEARYYWERALEIDPRQPGLRRNLELIPAD
ncbi:MAG: tetratricopeptide repeat protein [Candidatus Erginobacter occultus]|nr:tetratricopeptide repeat protein [Candidatus Erginobacter occultus]